MTYTCCDCSPGSGSAASSTFHTSGRNCSNSAAGTAVNPGDPGALSHLMGFTGRPFDVDSCLNWHLNRWYDTVVARWMSEDPIGFVAGDLNLYRYVGNGPLNAVDPYGLLRSHFPLTLINEIIQSTDQKSSSKIMMLMPLRLGMFLGMLLRPNDTTFTLRDHMDEVFKPNMGLVKNFYGAFLAKNADSRGGWRDIYFQVKDVRSRYTGQWYVPPGSTLDTGWWLNGSEGVGAVGTMQVCRRFGANGEPLFAVRNIEVDWLWRDRIDGRTLSRWWREDGKTEWARLINSFNPFSQRRYDPSDLLGFLGSNINAVVESIYWKIFGDLLLNADFGLNVEWKHVEPNEILVYPPQP